MVDSSPGITAALQATGDVSVTVNSAFPGWGLTVDHSWLSGCRGPWRTIRSRSPWACGAGTTKRRSQTPPATGPFFTQYVTALLAPPDGVKLVVLLQFPRGGPTNRSPTPSREKAWEQETAATNAWDDAVRRVVADFPGRALYLTTQQLFAPDGRFLTWMRTPGGSWFAPASSTTFTCVPMAQRSSARGDGGDDADPQPGCAQAGVGVRVMDDTPLQRSAGACPDDQPPAGYRGTPVPGATSKVSMRVARGPDRARNSECTHAVVQWENEGWHP